MVRTSITALAVLAFTGIAGTAAAQSTDWTGGYVSLYGAYTQADEDSDETLVFDRDFDGDFDDTVTTQAGADAFSPGSCDGAASGSTPANGCQDDGEGIGAGGRIGYDYQWGSFVVGGLLEHQAVDARDAVTSFSTTPAFYTATRTVETMGAARLRVGYAWGPALIYATGGYATADIENKFLTSNRTNAFSERQDNDEADGYQFGGGVEHMLAPGLSVGAEYVYSRLEQDEDYIVRVGTGAATQSNPFIQPPNTAGTDISRGNSDIELQQVRLTLNYRF